MLLFNNYYNNISIILSIFIIKFENLFKNGQRYRIL